MSFIGALELVGPTQRSHPIMKFRQRQVSSPYIHAHSSEIGAKCMCSDKRTVGGKNRKPAQVTEEWG